MLPSALASYAPTIRGVANSNAKVTVTQSGYKIYETTVPPGEFVIDDISPSGFGSELVVTIEEADGCQTHLYATLLVGCTNATSWCGPLGFQRG